MNRFLLGIVALALSAGLAHAEAPRPSAPLLLAQSPAGNSNNPYNSPIRRANPNSMQGTRPAAPVIRAPNTVPVPRPPTLDNGGIGNGYPRPNATPGTVRPYVSPAPPPRDPDTSNR